MGKRARYLHEHKLWIENELFEEEPMHCEHARCKEELNGLNCYMIELVRGFKFCIWLCNKHAKMLEEKTK